jgi:hypothetical protein
MNGRTEHRTWTGKDVACRHIVHLSIRPFVHVPTTIKHLNNNMMKTEICIFEGNQVSFYFGRENDVMVNATEMAKIFGKEVAFFMRNDDTKRFIEACLKTANSQFLGIKSEEDLILSRQKSGTLMHRVLALKFAAWLDSDFEVWVYSTIENLLFGRHIKREQSFERTIALQKEREELQEKHDKTGEDFERYIQVQRELKREVALRKSLTTEGLCSMKGLF